MIEYKLLTLLAGCALFVLVLAGIAQLIDAWRQHTEQGEIARSDDWERQMQEDKHDF